MSDDPTGSGTNETGDTDPDGDPDADADLDTDADEWSNGEVPDIDGADADTGSSAGPWRERGPGAEDSPDIGDLFDELEELEELVDTPEEREQVRETMRLAMEVREPTVFGRVISGFDASDAAEALLGSLLFGIPMFVEGGTREVAEFVAARPVHLVATNALAVGLVVGILYVADIQNVRIHNPILGIFPRKLVGVLVTAFGTALFMMTAWGRVDWSEPWLAFCAVSVAFVPMAIGAALGDLLPG